MCVLLYIWMWLRIYLLLTSVIYILWYVSGIKAVAVSKTTKGKKWQKVIQVLLGSRHFWSYHDFWKAFKVPKSENSLLYVAVYMHCLTYIALGLSLGDLVAYLANCLSFNKLECSRGQIIRLGRVSLDQVEVAFPLQGTDVIVVQIPE